MTTVAYDAYVTYYEERADLAFEWTEEGVNKYGLPSHSTRPGDGVQYDATGVNRFAVFGFRSARGAPSLRRITNFPQEGNHETSGVYVFKVPLAGVTYTDVRLKYVYTVQGTDTEHVSTLYAVACDSFVSRQMDAATGYPMTYRNEFHAPTWGRQRRYRSDSLEYEQAHTDAAVDWTFAPQAGVQLSSPNIASVVNEVTSRPGWASGNLLCLVNAPRNTVSTTPYAPDLYAELSFPSEISVYPFCAEATPTLTLTY